VKPRDLANIPLHLGVGLGLVVSLLGLSFHSNGAYNPTRHSRFIVGTFPDAPVPNPDFWLARYEPQLRGIGWEADYPKQKVALISPQHFLTATHYRATGPITFLGEDGNLHSFLVDRINQVSLDISIGTFVLPIPGGLGIHPFPVADIQKGEPRGTEVFYFGNAPSGPLTIAAGKTRFGGMKNESVAELDPGRIGGDWVIGVSGDSGCPSFFLVDEELILLGHHYTPYEDFVLGAQAEAVNDYMEPEKYALDLRRVPTGCGNGFGQGAFAALAAAFVPISLKPGLSRRSPRRQERQLNG